MQKLPIILLSIAIIAQGFWIHLVQDKLDHLPLSKNWRITSYNVNTGLCSYVETDPDYIIQMVVDLNTKHEELVNSLGYKFIPTDYQRTDAHYEKITK